MKNKFVLSLFILLITIFFSCSNSKKATEHYLNAVREYEQKNFDKSKEFLDLSLKAKSNFFQAEFLKAKISFFEKKFSDAEKTFYSLSKKNSKHLDCKLWLLRTYFFSKQFEKANELLSELTMINCEDWRLYYWKAQLAKHNDDFESYFLCLNKADEFLRDSQNVYLDLALIWHELGLAEKSSFYYSKAKSINSKYQQN